MNLALSIALLLCVAVNLMYRFRTRKNFNMLDKMLDEAISGEFEPKSYDETELSKIESKLSRFLSGSKLKKGQIESEQKKIHSLISDISHQTKTPIANILLYSQLLAEQKDIPIEAKSFTTQITIGTEKLNFLIQSLITTSRLENGIIKVIPNKNDVNELILAVCTQCNPKANSKGIKITFETTSEPAIAMFDPKWCAEALNNIMDNAIKYTHNGGQVDISLKSYEMFIRIDIKDNGKGISEENLPLVFGRFFRGKDTADVEGVGIGLFLAREIVLACGGYIKVSSEVNKGSVFYIFLPKEK